MNGCFEGAQKTTRTTAVLAAAVLLRSKYGTGSTRPTPVVQINDRDRLFLTEAADEAL